MDNTQFQPVENLPEWLPGDITFESRPREHPDLMLRGFTYGCQDVKVPPMEDYTIALFHCSGGAVGNMAHGQWQDTQVQSGNVTIMTRGEDTRWRWSGPIKVTHLYLTHAALNEVAASAFATDKECVRLPNVLHTDDAMLRRIVQMLYNELCADMIGVDLLLETLQTQLCVHLLRRYATIDMERRIASGGLSRVQRKDIVAFIRENIHRKITLPELSRLLRMSASQTIRTFRSEFGATPHAYVLQQRFEHAKEMIRRMPDAPLKMVAIDSGFSDQSHMTRVFQRMLHQSPGGYRADCRRKTPTIASITALEPVNEA